MKKVVIIVIALLFSTVTFSQNYTEITSSQLPKKTNEWIKKNMPGATMGKIGKAGEKSATKYAVVLSDRGRKAIYVFDNNGNFIKRAKNKEELMSMVKADSKSTAPAKTDPPAKK